MRKFVRIFGSEQDVYGSFRAKDHKLAIAFHQMPAAAAHLVFEVGAAHFRLDPMQRAAHHAAIAHGLGRKDLIDPRGGRQSDG